MIIIDAPDEIYSSTESWQRFLAEMHRAVAAADAEDIEEIRHWIGVADGVLKGRNKN